MTTVTVDAPLSSDVKKSVGIVLVGNFLDFFDLMLAVHLTVVLTKVFIPSDSYLTPMLTVFTFCSSFLHSSVSGYFLGVHWRHNWQGSCFGLDDVFDVHFLYPYSEHSPLRRVYLFHTFL